MPKPWAKYEIGFLHHAKFLALTSNAICLWLEAKSYCDEHLTDGLFPRVALRTFRFNGGKSVQSLMQSCGVKPNGKPFAPLWEAVDIGGVAYIRMHDFLDHNDCREEAMARIEQAEERRESERDRLKKWRALKKAKRETADETPYETLDETPTETADDTPVKRSIQNQQQQQHQKLRVCG